jgi:hypothetical protein
MALENQESKPIESVYKTRDFFADEEHLDWYLNHAAAEGWRLLAVVAIPATSTYSYVRMRHYFERATAVPAPEKESH